LLLEPFLFQNFPPKAKNKKSPKIIKPITNEAIDKPKAAFDIEATSSSSLLFVEEESEESEVVAPFG
jgi:hypothetical protein